jgi:hypothetical protein
MSGPAAGPGHNGSVRGRAVLSEEYAGIARVHSSGRPGLEATNGQNSRVDAARLNGLRSRHCRRAADARRARAPVTTGTRGIAASPPTIERWKA